MFNNRKNVTLMFIKNDKKGTIIGYSITHDNLGTYVTLVQYFILVEMLNFTRIFGIRIRDLVGSR